MSDTEWKTYHDHIHGVGKSSMIFHPPGAEPL